MKCQVQTGIALILFIISQVSSTGVFKLELIQFTNDNGLLIDRTCCNGLLINDSCTQACSTYFRICLKHFQRDITTDQCTYGEFTTDVMGGNSIRFPRASESGTFVNPLEFKIDFAWTGDFSLILEAYHESSTNTQVAQLIASLRGSSSVLPSDDWKFQQWNGSNIEAPQSMQFRYKIECDANFFGDACTTICTPRNDDLGHYECGPNGEKICRQGWEGEYCAKAICLEGCHNEHGYCNQPNECSCRVGWQGRLCNECLVYPDCEHGYCEKAWECTCYEGWGGLYCNQDLNYCTNNRPCQNGGTCTNTGQGSYTCTCPVGYTGNNCETEVDNCRINPCQNGGVCKDIGNDFLCECPQGFAGSHCEISAARCDQNPCANGGQCQPIGSSYRCHCTAGWSGVNCQQERNECMSVDTPCQNGGTCIDGMNTFSCQCPNGFSGTNCEVDENECAGENPCLNDGVCVDGHNGYQCRCKPGFVGEICQNDVDDCVTRPCANGGSCKDKVNDFQCFCAPGFTGRMCNEEINECASSPCRNGGSCEDLVNRFECHCTAEYEGDNCQYNLGEQPATLRLPTTTRRTTSSSTTTEESEVNRAETGAVSAGDDKDTTNVELSQPQLILIVCLGSGIPMILLFILVSILLYRRCRNRVDENRSEESQQNAANAMNNRIHNQVHKKSEVYEYPTAEKLVNDMESHQPVPLSYKNSAATHTANKLVHKDMIKDINTNKERQMQQQQKNVAVVSPSSGVVYTNSQQQENAANRTVDQQYLQYYQRNNSCNISPTNTHASQYSSPTGPHRNSSIAPHQPASRQSSTGSHLPTVCSNISPAASSTAGRRANDSCVYISDETTLSQAEGDYSSQHGSQQHPNNDPVYHNRPQYNATTV